MFKVIKKYKNDGIYQWPSTVLSEISQNVELPVKDKSVLDVIRRMTDWEIKHPKSQGLSAVQMGVLKRVAVVRIDNELFTLVNPRMFLKFGNQQSNEGCHSLYENRFIVRRSKCGVVEYFDIDGKKHFMRLNKKYVRLIEHELDHMNGILINKWGKPYEDTNINSTAKT